MSDIQKMEAGAALNMVIALRLGYTFEAHDVTPDYHGTGYYIKAPDGGYAWNGGYSNRKPAINRWQPIDFFTDDHFAPDWSHHTDAALALFNDGKPLSLHRFEDQWRAERQLVATAHGNTAALALCRLWLKLGERTTPASS